MEQTEAVAASPSPPPPPPPPPPAPLPADEDARQSPEQPETQLAAEGPQSGSLEPRESGQTAEGRVLQQPASSSLQLEFQDSSLSPGLSLLPQTSGVDDDAMQESLFQKSDTEFAPLRAYPDLSVASDRFPSPPDYSTTQVSDYASLSQHPLAQATLLSEEMVSSCSVSQVSVSLQEGTSQESSVHSSHAADDELEVSPSQETDAETSTEPSAQTAAPRDETDFLSSDVAAHDLLERLQKDVGVPSSSISTTTTVSCSSALGESESMKTIADVSAASREGPPGEAAQSPQIPAPPHTPSPGVANITVGSRSTEPDDVTAALHRELLSESEMGSSREARVSVSPPTDTLQTKSNGTETHPGGAPQASEQDLFASASQTGIEGSYLGFLPQSQSTPGVIKPPSMSSVHRAFEPLSTIESSFGCGGGIAAPEGDDPRRRTADLVQRGGATTRVQSLPSLNYLQKVDAWRENQSLGRTSLFDSLALQGFHGVSPKQRAYDAVSDTLNRILTQQARGLGQAAAVVGSSPGRGEAAGAQSSASPGARSQSHSSLSTVVMSTHKDQWTQNVAAAAAAAHPPTLTDLGAFSDVSIDMDLMLSSSQDSSSNSATKVGTSVGASSISLEVDNYAPYWTSKISTPPPARPRELNIEERIPVYLQNLGIDQSVSTILTPFAPRGPIREPEFSPTDLCTIKGSIGTPTRSAQPSEGGTPYKGEFSRSSVLSAASSISVPPSLDSLGPAFPERTRAPSAEVPQRASSSSSSRSAAEHGDLFLFGKAKDSCRSRWAEQSPEEPSANTGALLEIHSILSRARSDTSAALRLRADDDLFVSPRERGARPRESSSTAASVATCSGTGPSLLWARSSPDTMLTPGHLPDTSAESQVAIESSPPYDREAAVSLVAAKSARRAEPEGCSAAPPAAPQQPADEDEQSCSGPPSSSSSSPVEMQDAETQDAETQEGEQAVLSDGSSQSSLAVRVAALLQSESANAVMSSAASSTEQDQNQAREWIKLKLSGQQCEPLELDQEDRRRIEEIKRELLLKHPVQSQGSTDTDSITGSSSPAHTEPRPPAHPPPNLLLADLETQVRQIAAREGVVLPRSGARPLTSITIASRKRDSASSSPSPPVSPAPQRPAEEAEAEAESPATVLEAPLSAANRRRLYVPENLPPLRQEESSAAPRPGHVSHVRLTLSPKAANAARAHTEFVQLRHSTLAASSPDEGVGLCSPPEWSEGREAARTDTAALFRSAAAAAAQQRDAAATAAAAAIRTQTAPVPLLLPYKPPGSGELFYVPHTEAADLSDTTMESSHTGSDDAVPPQFSCEVLGQRDPGLDRGVTIRHPEGIYSKRSPAVSGRMQGAARRAADKSSQTTTSAPPKAPGRDLPASDRRQRPSSAPQSASGETLDQLWRRFYDRWRLEGAQPSGQREALLLECLSRLVSERRAGSGSGSQLPRPDLGGDWRDGRRPVRGERTPPPAAAAAATTARSRHFCPADRDESTTSGSVSTVDTARLVRAFGAQRVQQRPRGGASLGKLYGAISRQREEREEAGGTLAPTDESTVILDSSSSTSTHTPPLPQPRPSRLLAAKKAVRVVSRGVQAGELEIVSDATRRRTRDVGTIFPSPAATLRSSSSTAAAAAPAYGAERDRRGQRSASRTHRKPKRAVSWFIPADDLRAEARKENAPEEPRGRSVWWVEASRRSPPWREPLRMRQLHQQTDHHHHHHHHHPPPATSKIGSSHHTQPLSLQEALHLHRPDFISRSRRRMLCLLQQEEDRKLHGGFSHEREEFYHLPYGTLGRTHRPAGGTVVRRAVPRKEMIQRSKQIYDSLPEVQRKREEQRRQAEYRTYRLNARLYNRRITNRVLGRRTAW